MIETRKTDSQMHAEKKKDRHRGIRTPGLSQVKELAKEIGPEMVCGTIEMKQGTGGKEETYQAVYSHMKNPIEYLTERYSKLISDHYVSRPHLTTDDEMFSLVFIC